MNAPALAAHLERMGLANPDGISRAASYRRCKDCGAHVLVGLDADMCGLAVVTDTTDLDPVAELLVLLAGRRCYRVLELGDRIELGRRSRWSISGADQSRPVVANHVCGTAPPSSTSWRWRIPDVATPPDSPPPF